MIQQLPANWESMRTSVYERDDYTCQDCGSKGGPEGDNRVIVYYNTSSGDIGSMELSNLNTVCRECHNQYLQPLSEPTGGGKGVKGLIQQLDLLSAIDIMESHLDFMQDFEELSNESQSFVTNSIESLRSCISSAEDLTNEYPELTEPTKQKYRNHKQSINKELRNGYIILLNLEELAVYTSFYPSYEHYEQYAKSFRDTYFLLEDIRNGLETGIKIDEDENVYIDELELVKKYVNSGQIFDDTGSLVVDEIESMNQVTPKLQRSLKNDKQEIKRTINELS